MATPKNYKQVIALVESTSPSVRAYFEAVTELIEHYEWDVSISYTYARIETIKRRTLFVGLVRKHRADAEYTDKELDREFLTRSRFKQLFSIVYGRDIPKDIIEILERGEAVRDRVAHGKWLVDAQARQCLADAFQFADRLNEFVFECVKTRPIGSLQGFKGAASALPRETTYWVLKGMGVGQKAAS